MAETTPEENKAAVLAAFDLLFNQRAYEKYSATIWMRGWRQSR